MKTLALLLCAAAAFACSSAATGPAPCDGGCPANGDAGTPALDGGSFAQDAGAPGVNTGTMLLAGNYTLDGVTSDGYVIVTDSNSEFRSTVYAVTAAGARTTVGDFSVFIHVRVSGDKALIWSGGTASNGYLGGLTIWSAGATHTFTGAYDLAGAVLGSRVVYLASAADGRDLVGANLDGTGATTLHTNLAYNRAPRGCVPVVEPRAAANRFIVTRCASGSEDVSLSAISAADFAVSEISPFLADWASDPSGASIYYTDIDGHLFGWSSAGRTAQIDLGVGKFAVLPDSSVVYQYSSVVERSLRRAVVAGLTASTSLLAAGATKLHAVSPDGARAAFGTKEGTGVQVFSSDLNLVAPPAAPQVLDAAPEVEFNTTASFTADSQYVLYLLTPDNQTDMLDGIGTLVAGSVHTLVPTIWGARAWEAFQAGGSRIVFQDNWLYSQTAPTHYLADLRVADVASRQPPRLIASGARIDLAFDAQRTHVFYLVDGAAGAALYMAPLQ